MISIAHFFASLSLVTLRGVALPERGNNHVTSTWKHLQLDRSASPVSDERHDTDADSHPSFYHR
jgi:hypothetical protein